MRNTVYLVDRGIKVLFPTLTAGAPDLHACGRTPAGLSVRTWHSQVVRLNLRAALEADTDAVAKIYIKSWNEGLGVLGFGPRRASCGEARQTHGWTGK